MKALALLIPLALVATATGDGTGAPPDGDDKQKTPRAPDVPTGDRAATRKALRGYAEILEYALGWEDLAQFLDATAWTESRWLYRPKGRVPESGSNRATGPYQLRPNSAGDTKALRARFLAEPWLLEHPIVATAAVVAYVSRQSDDNPNATQEQARAALAYPVFAKGRPVVFNESLAKASPLKTLKQQQDRYDLAINNYREALQAAGYPDWLGRTPLYPRVRRYTVAQLLPLLGWPTLPPEGADPW